VPRLRPRRQQQTRRRSECRSALFPNRQSPVTTPSFSAAAPCQRQRTGPRGYTRSECGVPPMQAHNHGAVAAALRQESCTRSHTSQCVESARGAPSPNTLLHVGTRYPAARRHPLSGLRRSTSSTPRQVANPATFPLTPAPPTPSQRPCVRCTPCCNPLGRLQIACRPPARERELQHSTAAQLSLIARPKRTTSHSVCVLPPRPQTRHADVVSRLMRAVCRRASLFGARRRSRMVA
jgi:hypothetical protein